VVPDKSTPVVVYYGFVQRSPFAAATLVGLGYTKVKNYRDGFFAWRGAKMPVVMIDAAPASFLYALPQEVIPGVWSAIGATAPGTYENSGHNNNLSFVITDDGVLVVNAGNNYLLAQSLHDEIKQRSTQPVKYVVLENSQGHAMPGSGYWKSQGAKIIAHRDTVKEMQKNGYESLATMRGRARDKAYRTEFVLPDTVYDDRLDLKIGSWKLQILHPGKSHSHGDTMVWLPERNWSLRATPRSTSACCRFSRTPIPPAGSPRGTHLKRSARPPSSPVTAARPTCRRCANGRAITWFTCAPGWAKSSSAAARSTTRTRSIKRRICTCIRRTNSRAVTPVGCSARWSLNDGVE
jgi:hypothetical protein